MAFWHYFKNVVVTNAKAGGSIEGILVQISSCIYVLEYTYVVVNVEY